MRGCSAHGRLASSVRRAEAAWTEGHLVHLPAGYPALLDGSKGRVYGELLELSGDRLLAELDIYEGYEPGFADRSLYQRVQRTVVGEESGACFAWCYVMPVALKSRLLSEGARLVANGRWQPNLLLGDAYSP